MTALPATLKKSVRRLLVDQREFSNAFFAAVDSQIDTAIDELFTGGKEKPAQPASSKSLSLSLVEYDEMEEAMVIDRFSSRIRNAADILVHAADSTPCEGAADSRTGRT